MATVIYGCIFRHNYFYISNDARKDEIYRAVFERHDQDIPR